MSKRHPNSIRRYPLYVHISILFTLLLLSSGAVVGVFNYQQTSHIILSSSEQLFTRIRQEVQVDLDHTYTPIRHALNLLALNPNTRLIDAKGREKVLPAFAQALRDNPKLASLYLGYPDGDFMMVRPLRTDAQRQLFDAPSEAAFQLWSIDRSTNDNNSSYQFFDAQLNLLRRIQRPVEQYDPRQRPWYINAREQPTQITTAPYAFFSTHEVGTTLARQIGNDVVLGADLTLSNLCATLAKNKITAGSEVVLLDPSGNAIAYPDCPPLVVDSQLVKAADLSAPLAALLAPVHRRDVCALTSATGSSRAQH